MTKQLYQFKTATKSDSWKALADTIRTKGGFPDLPPQANDPALKKRCWHELLSSAWVSAWTCLRRRDAKKKPQPTMAMNSALRILQFSIWHSHEVISDRRILWCRLEFHQYLRAGDHDRETRGTRASLKTGKGIERTDRYFIYSFSLFFGLLAYAKYCLFCSNDPLTMKLLWMGCLENRRPGYATLFQEEISRLFDTVSLGLQRHIKSRGLRWFPNTSVAMLSGVRRLG